MTDFDFYAMRVRNLLGVKALPPEFVPIVQGAFAADWPPELAADDCMLVSMGAYSGDADHVPAQRTGE